MAKGIIHRILPRRGVYSLKQISDTVTPIARRYGAEKVYLFGSYARGEADRFSDIDLLVHPGMIEGTAIARFMREISDALDRDVDIVTNRMDPKFLSMISEDLVLIYAE